MSRQPLMLVQRRRNSRKRGKMRQIRFEKLKQIAEDNVHFIVRSLADRGGWWTVPAMACLASVQDYLRDGTVTGTRDQIKSLRCALRDVIRSIDVRMVGDLIWLLRLGDYGAPAWVLNGPVEVSLEDDGWIVRSAA